MPLKLKTYFIPGSSGGRLNKKDGLTRYGNSHVKDKTVSPTVLSLTWESPYLGKTVFILRRGPDNGYFFIFFQFCHVVHVYSFYKSVSFLKLTCCYTCWYTYVEICIDCLFHIWISFYRIWYSRFLWTVFCKMFSYWLWFTPDSSTMLSVHCLFKTVKLLIPSASFSGQFRSFIKLTFYQIALTGS